MSAIKFTAQRGLSTLGDEKGVWMADTTAETLAGSELVTNGGFATDLTGWADSGSDWSQSAGVASTTGASASYLYQTVTTIANKTYIVSGSITGAIFCGAWDTAPTSALLSDSSSTRTGEFLFMFTASDSTSTISFSAGAGATLDNVSVRPAVPDLSTANNGLGVYGSITKSSVTTGADLVAYSGFSASNYLEQPYNSDLDFGTGDFNIGLWFNTTNPAVGFFDHKKTTWVAGDPRIQIQSSADGSLDCYFITNHLLTSVIVNDGIWHKVDVSRVNGIAYLYLDGALLTSISNTDNLTDMSAITRIGIQIHSSGNYTNDSNISLVRVGNGLTAAQVKNIYDKEKHLFKKHSYYTQEGIEYSLDIPLSDAPQSVDEHKTENHSWDRTQTENIFDGQDNVYNITTGLLHRTDNTYPRESEYLEFLHATRASELFTIDFYGTVASEDEPKTFVRVGNAGQLSREGNQWRRSSFKVFER